MTNEYDIITAYKAVNGRCAVLEQQIISEYIAFLRQLALHFIERGVKVYFVENRRVHWGEYNFGTLYIDTEEPRDIWYLKSVTWGSPRHARKDIDPSNYEITAKNIDHIQYVGLGFERGAI